MLGHWHKLARYYTHEMARRIGYRADQWVRVVQVDDWCEFLAKLPTARLDALEIVAEAAPREAVVRFADVR